jgi:hypothetical protein
MSGDSGFVITPADRESLLHGPLGAVLMLGGDRTAGRLSLADLASRYGLDVDLASIPRLAAAHGLRVPRRA